MTRAVHWHNVPWANRTACGRMIARVLASTIERDVTAPCCLKLIAQQPSGAADGHKTSSSTVQPESEKTARAAQDARESHRAERLRKSEQNRTGSVAIREPSAASASAPSVIYLHLGKQRRFGQDYVRIWDWSLEPKEGLSRFERFDRGAVAHGISLTAQSMLSERADHIHHLQDHCARLESLLREVVEAWDRWDYCGESSVEQWVSGGEATKAAIEAARVGIGGKNG